MISDIRQVTVPELRQWAMQHRVEIRELESRDLLGFRIFSAECGHETRVAKVPPDEPIAIREKWDEYVRAALARMTEPELRRYLAEHPVYGYLGPQT
ncbi:hypothetical protein ACFOVU_15450 [Nocardiopsis sediminis]|uniref:Uncharacterized protein n=1 Tax=Nocardiopsis sediminis TaxID=1778267 RepID=A0ABV8FMN7_9ACTN